MATKHTRTSTIATQTTNLQNIALALLLQLNPEAYNKNRFSTSSKNCSSGGDLKRRSYTHADLRLGDLRRGPAVLRKALPAGTRLTLFSDDKPARFFTVIKFWLDETSGVALALEGGVPAYRVEDEEGRTHLLIHLPIEEEDDDRWCLWRPDLVGFDTRSVFDRAMVEE
jgi:hypothetical protein